MVINPSILFAKVMHRRTMPKVNTFVYGIYYLVFPLSRMNELADSWRFGVDSPGLLSFYQKDHGKRDGTDLTVWIKSILRDNAITTADGDIVMIALPRVFGYVFNPVSFWMCLDKSGGLRAVLAEVNNTFGERHSYLCVHTDQRIITEKDVLHGEKLFHVSPFLEREGSYTFRFSFKDSAFGTWIDYTDRDGKKLLTALTGSLSAYNSTSRRRAFWRYPLVTLHTIFSIHWQALKLIAKGIRYVAKPIQLSNRLTKASDITKN